MNAVTANAQRVFVGTLAELAAQKLLWVRLAPDVYARPREAIVVLDARHVPRAYLNLCRHIPIPLDGGSRRFLIGGELQCATHGARYRLEDGLCVTGPCRGESLFALALELVAEIVFVVDDPSVCI